MIYHLETIDRTIAKIIRDLGKGTSEIPWQDYVEWIAEALEHIGSYPQLEEREAIISVYDYVAKLPCDLYKLIRIKDYCYSDCREDGFYQCSLVQMFADAGCDKLKVGAYDRYFTLSYGHNTVDLIDRFSNNLSFNKGLINPKVDNPHFSKDYNLQLDKVTTAFPQGLLHVHYLAFPLDERGFPLVPDNVSFRDALFWKCAYHISMRDPKCLANPRMQDMEYCRQMWNKYCTQARGNANMPNPQGVERFKNNFMRLFNYPDEDMVDYRYIGKPQLLDFNGRR